MLVGPMLPPPITRGEDGGAAGNRTRVRSAYYKRVYRHSPGEPGPLQYRRIGDGIQEARCEQANMPLSVETCVAAYMPTGRGWAEPRSIWRMVS